MLRVITHHAAKPMNRPTQRDIAKIANVSPVAVSLALRGHGRISKATRDRIVAIAKEIGYQPDPLLSALTRYSRPAVPTDYQGTLAWINSYRQPEMLAQHYAYYLRGAQERCGELGFTLDEFRMVELGMNYRRLSNVLRARNIQGVLFPPQDSERRHITIANFDWDRFSSVAFGFSLMRPKLDLVTNAQFRSARMAMRKLRSLGYRRIGFVISHRSSERSDQNFLAGFLIEQQRLLASERVPVHFILGGSAAETQRRLREWRDVNAPDAILAATWLEEWWGRLDIVTSAGNKRCGVALLDVPDGNTVETGVSQNNLIVGRTAVDILVAKVYANQRGLPVAPLRTLVEGRWVAGTTAPRIVVR